MQTRADLRRLARPKTTLLLGGVLLISSLFLFTLFASEPYFFSWPRGTVGNALAPGNTTETARDLTTRLDPDAHRRRENSTLSFDWVITKGYRYPDGVGKQVYLINGQFPGPNIEARSGDSVIIHVHNELDHEGVSLHFHGLHMRGSNRMDGVVGVTQKAIPSGQSFAYSFQISSNQSGTFWWHAHSEVQRADGIFGAFVVHEPLTEETGSVDSVAVTPHEYGEDILLLIGDWYHLTATEVQASYDTYEYWGMEPVPDSLLVNGIGAFNCSMAVPARPLDCLQVSAPRLKPRSSKSRLRIINVGAMSGITFRTPGRLISLITLDGGNKVAASTPPSSGIGVLYPGERVDVVVDWTLNNVDGLSSLDRFEISLDRENFQKKNLALTPDQSFPLDIEPSLASPLGSRAAVSAPKPDILDLRKVEGPELVSAQLNHEPSQVVLVYTRVELLAHLGNAPKGYINRTYWEPQENPLVDMERDGWDTHQLVPLIPFSQKDDAWVDIVINNVDEKGHPFHLHGYDFYVVSDFKPTRRGWFAFNPFDRSRKPAGGAYNVINPRKKDTIFVAANGYVVVRIKPDNPGLWFLHCHILWHQAVGMAMTLQVV